MVRVTRTVEGELPEDGLAAYGDDGDDLMLALARKIVNGDEDEAATVESVFARARESEAESEEYLVDSGWKGVEPEPIVTNLHHSKAWTDAAATVVSGQCDNETQRFRGRCSPARSSLPGSRATTALAPTNLFCTRAMTELVFVVYSPSGRLWVAEIGTTAAPSLRPDRVRAK